MHQRVAHIVGLRRWKCRQQTRPCFDQHDACGARIDAPEIGGQSLPCDLGDGAGHFDAGGAAADNDEGKQPLLLVRIGHDLGLLKRNQDAAANAGGVFDALQARCDVGPFVMAKIGMHRAGRDHQIVVRQVAGIGVNALLRGIDAADIGHQHGGVFLRLQDMADRPGDIGRRQRRGRDLIEQRLKAVMVLAVDHGDVGIGAPQRLDSLEAAETAADNDHFGTLFRHGRSWVAASFRPRTAIAKHWLPSPCCQAGGEALAIRNSDELQ